MKLYLYEETPDYEKNFLSFNGILLKSAIALQFSRPEGDLFIEYNN